MVKLAYVLCSSFTPETSQLDALDSSSLWNGDGSLCDTLLYLTQTVGFKDFIFIYLKIMYSKNLCNQRCSEELQLFSCNEDKPMLMLSKMDENVSKERICKSKIVLNCQLNPPVGNIGFFLLNYKYTKCHLIFCELG